MKYLKKFETHEDYEVYLTGGTMVKPNVSYCEDFDDVHYNPWTWADAYFTTVALEDGTISFDIFRGIGTNMITSISYSKDEGKTWTTTENVDDKSENLVIDVSVSEGDNVLWKGVAQQLAYYDESNDEFLNSFFSSDCEFDVMGNVMSLLYGDNFVGEITIQEECCFFGLFCDYYNYEKECLVANANNLKLPAKTLAKRCYSSMFNGCTSLTTAPELPATTLANGCYESMFENCTSLISAPELPATTLADYCYNGMFYGCTSLTTAPILPATTLADYCYKNMFYGCTGLTSAPELPATTLADYCYNYMFANCTSLTSAPELPATTLAEGCYQAMFYGCTGLTSAPELPDITLANNCYSGMFNGCTSLTSAPELSATTLAQSCYSSMFGGCTSLTSAPELPATTLVTYCYHYMFYGCTNLNYIKAMFTTTPSTTYTQNWVSGVAASGTYVKNSAASYTKRGASAIPNGWTVETASE